MSCRCRTMTPDMFLHDMAPSRFTRHQMLARQRGEPAGDIRRGTGEQRLYRALSGQSQVGPGKVPRPEL